MRNWHAPPRWQFKLRSLLLAQAASALIVAFGVLCYHLPALLWPVWFVALRGAVVALATAIGGAWPGGSRQGVRAALRRVMVADLLIAAFGLLPWLTFGADGLVFSLKFLAVNPLTLLAPLLATVAAIRDTHLAVVVGLLVSIVGIPVVGVTIGSSLFELPYPLAQLLGGMVCLGTFLLLPAGVIGTIVVRLAMVPPPIRQLAPAWLSAEQLAAIAAKDRSGRQAAIDARRSFASQGNRSHDR